MTVCLAAIAEGAIVLMSDRLVTRPGSIESEEERPKRIELIGGWHALYAGDTDLAKELVRRTNTRLAAISGRIIAAADVTASARSAYEEVWLRHLEESVLIRRGITLAMWQRGPSRILPAEVIQDIQRDFRDESIVGDGFDVILCGFDEDAHPRIFIVNEDGPRDRSEDDFAAVGIGQEVATVRLVWWHEREPQPLSRTLYHVFDAKAEAEINAGVGYEIDAWVLRGGQLADVPQEIISLMDVVYDDATKSPFTDERTGHVRRTRGLPSWRDRWRAELDRFATELDAYSVPDWLARLHALRQGRV